MKIYIYPQAELHSTTDQAAATSDAVVLTPKCGFPSVFTGPQKSVPLSVVKHPVSEVAYSRSDYDGHRWWTTWFHCQEERLPSNLSSEVDTFMETLIELPEFQSLHTMRQMCQCCAEPTSDPTEYNLYAETAHFHLWLRLITREKDYNLYVHFYQNNI